MPFSLCVANVSKADKERIRLKKEGPHVVMNCMFS